MTLPTTDAPRVSDDEIIDSISTTYDFGWHDSDEAGENARRGLDEQVVREISALKDEPEWMLAKRLKAYEIFERKPMPTWGVDLSELDMDAVKYYVRSTDRPANSWDDLPEDIKTTYDRIGIPEAERERLVAGVAAQYESEVVYHEDDALLLQVTADLVVERPPTRTGRPRRPPGARARPRGCRCGRRCS